MSEPTETSLDEIRTDFLSFLKFTKGYSENTCYGYSSDLNRWHNWLTLAKLTWDFAKASDVENFLAYLVKETVGAHTIARSRDSFLVVRQRYELLFELIQKSGLRISEALGLKRRHRLSTPSRLCPCESIETCMRHRVADWLYSTFHRYVVKGVYPLDWCGDVNSVLDGGA